MKKQNSELTAFEKYQREFQAKTRFVSFKDDNNVLMTTEMVAELFIEDKLYRVRKNESDVVTYELQVYVQAPKPIGDLIISIGQFHYEHLYEVIAELFRIITGDLEFEFDEFGFITGKTYRFKENR